MKYRPDIDGLRAVAVLSVVFCHAGIALPGGYVGVDVFFALSGYLIASLMLKDLQAGTFSLAHFWERRIRRILPALCVVVTACFFCGWFLLVPKAYRMLGRSVVSLMLLHSNVFFARHADYFAPGDDAKPLLHTWSLSVEEQFYLIVPLLFWGALRFRRQAWLKPVIGVLAAASFAYSVYGTMMWPQQAYFAFSTRAWELLAGVLTALFWQNVPRLPASAREFAAGLGLAGVALPCWWYDSVTPFPGLAALPPVLGTVLLIVVGGNVGDGNVDQPTWVHRRLASRPAVGVGLISYSLYLWHWPLIVFLKTHGESLSTAMGQGMFLIAAIVLAFLTYWWVEQPLRRGVWLATRPKLIVATACVLACLLATGQLLRCSDGVIDRLPQRAQLFARTGVDDHASLCLHRPEDVPDRLLRVGTAGVEPRLLVWGDSHAGVVMPVIDEMCRASGISARCAMYPGRPPVKHHCIQESPQALAEANAFGAVVMDYAKSSDVDTVLLAGFWGLYFPHARFADSLMQTVDELRAADRRVYFLKDIPVYDFDVAAALILREWRGSDLDALSFSPQDYAAQHRHYETLLPRLAARGVQVLDPVAYLRAGRSSGPIPPYDAGGSFYYDRHHLSLYGARTIQPVFHPVIDAVAQSSPSRAPLHLATPIRTTDATKPASRLR